LRRRSQRGGLIIFFEIFGHEEDRRAMSARTNTSTNFYARAAIMWGVAGGILFIPCAMMLVALAWLLNSGWTFPLLVMLGIVLTYGGVYLFFTGGTAESAWSAASVSGTARHMS